MLQPAFEIVGRFRARGSGEEDVGGEEGDQFGARSISGLRAESRAQYRNSMQEGNAAGRFAYVFLDDAPYADGIAILNGDLGLKTAVRKRGRGNLGGRGTGGADLLV